MARAPVGQRHNAHCHAMPSPCDETLPSRHACLHACLHACIHASMPCHVFSDRRNICICSFRSAPRACLPPGRILVVTHMHMYIHAHARTHTHAHIIHTHTHTHTHTRTCAHIRAHACTHACTCIASHSSSSSPRSPRSPRRRDSSSHRARATRCILRRRPAALHPPPSKSLVSR